ncbi:probable GPI-anchored adhesin-like protein PGA55 isoform X1 [Nicotiana tomentosiformis]|uniref:probable GPI-anchored adhesin-like protein PGA55 isoform X1 n=1 Tax=Nicotiana tomentosiformis TaxID=4098 RepID=UPI00051B1EAF|nr:uncharacterized protein LOC104101718 isoform X3 [Nicotiana tomentosiformis]
MSKQVLDSVDSRSNPSEPPNIGIWFSSYTYESPVLSGIDENVASQGDIQSPIKVGRASDNIPFSSVLSESLDTKDCFSSFVPETPGLADSDDFRVPESIDISFKEDTSTKGCKEDSISKEEDNSAENRTNGKYVSLSSGVDVASKGLVQCTNYVADNKRDVDSSNDMSLASEPPDIGNWFSSYVYESPKVDTIQEFILPDHEKEFDDKVYMNGDNGCGEPQNLRNSLGSGFIHDDKYEHLPVSKNQDADGTNNTRVTKEMSRERISQQTLYHKKTQNSKCGSPRYIDMVIKDSKTAGEHLETISPQEANCKVSCIINHSSCEGEKLYKHPIHRTDSEENSPKSEDCVEPAYNVQPKNSPVARVLSQKLSKREAGEITDKENNINGLGENGFRSTRKNRNSQLHNGSPLPRPSAVQSPSLSGITVASNCHKHVLTRKVLTETTNLHPSALETTGKWRCPQRTKPDLGPPLKQLRLEQWVRRA